MSGILGEAFTPCPSKPRSSGGSNRSWAETLDSFLDDSTAFETTEQIEFTTEIQAPTLTAVRPRRSNRAGSGFHIHDDGAEKPTWPAEKRQRSDEVTKQGAERKASLLAQPAQRFRAKPNFAPNSPLAEEKENEVHHTSGRLENNPKKKPRALGSNECVSDPGPQKNMERNTVYVPPDEMAASSVFMGLFSPLKNDKHKTLPQATESTQLNTREMTRKQQAPKSLSANARRAPLQPSAIISQEAAFRVDVVGKNGGKENIPPGGLMELGKKEDSQRTKSFNNRASRNVPEKPPLRTATCHLKSSRSREASTATKPTLAKRGVLGDKTNHTKSSPACKGPIQNNKNALKVSTAQVPSASLSARASALANRTGHSGPSRGSTSQRSAAKLKPRTLDSQYPKLTEGIKNPVLYEDDWLSHQETVISQLVNALFEHSNGSSDFSDHNTLRLECLEIYHTDYFIELYKKLQASLSCGVMSMPQHVLSRSYCLKQDVGLRRKFLDIWVKSYNVHALAAAAETVIGRKVFNDHDLFEDSPKSDNHVQPAKSTIKKLEGFLDTFLLRNDDSNQSVTCAYQRTVLRSIMLIALIDRAKQSLGSSLPRQLFLPSSLFKSSVGVLQALARVLLPSCGDIVKPVSHLGCSLSYKQHELQEYNYQMANIAVDLRDGVRLTRIVEILFYTSKGARSTGGDQTELTLKTGEVFSLLGDNADVPLSKHLKYPCVSRASKIFNVQIALSALESVKGSNVVLDDVRAEDIVDGYREKTIALLWALVGNWGLAGLVDWDDVTKEISRLKRKCLAKIGNEQVKSEMWFTGEQFGDANHHIELLQHWAGLLAGLQGLQFNNMTTSFADGKIYGSVVDEYEPYITGAQNTQNLHAKGPVSPMSLESRLHQLGCSTRFSRLVSPGCSASSHILGREFTLGALAFLCSRLLSASKRPRAATVLQRAWRARLERRNMLRRTIAKNLATHCAAVVQTRNELLWATNVITRWWRRIQTQRSQACATRPQALRKPIRNPAGRHR
ncbi:uncharacterized protein N7483_010083 [Penicillium malachiteum]|uniref:uncharacterized protein n=1 Tax=Penicillium malachiteum TaxID=1324776 RepID=UPI0025472F48|nr:uncharacterized protein N7483_010083 [Penicillium malachiteum]KAJ5712902.1 hypothetical protein N7483_010083 [Penicillium malachiteum]